MKKDECEKLSFKNLKNKYPDFKIRIFFTGKRIHKFPEVTNTDILLHSLCGTEYAGRSNEQIGLIEIPNYEKETNFDDPKIKILRRLECTTCQSIFDGDQGFSYQEDYSWI